MKPIILLELNEVCMPYLQKYAAMGLLPAFSKLIDRHGIVETVSETADDNLEPWIQWVTVHSGLAFDAHKVYRLGDIHDSEIRQIYEILEERGYKVGAVSPMNCANRTKDPSFFIPDPWTAGRVSGSDALRRLYRAISQAVNDNAQKRLSVGSFISLCEATLRYGSLRNLSRYLNYIIKVKSKPWSRALILDCLLSDVFFSLWRSSRPHFSTLFLNAAAHIQHHYLFNSKHYSGIEKNPPWYIDPPSDPVLEVYLLYDSIVAHALTLAPDSRIMLITGLSQIPCERIVYYYRLRNHAEFLKSINVPFSSVLPRMSRDFLVECANANEASEAQSILENGRFADGLGLFEVDNRGKSLFVTLTYPHKIEAGAEACFGTNQETKILMHDHVAFVAIKNARHTGIGYVIDTERRTAECNVRIPLESIFQSLSNALPSIEKGIAVRS